MAQPVKHYGKWRIRWLAADGKRFSETCNSRQEALFKLKQHQLEAEEIKRGLRKEPPTDKTFEELCDYWMAQRAVFKRSGRDDKSIIRCHLLPFFQNRRIRDIGVRDSDNYSFSRKNLSKKTLSNHLTLLISMLRLASDLKWISEVPRIKKPRIRLISKDFRYLRTTDEITRFLRSAEAEGIACLALYATAIYTGMRAGELAALHWEDVDMDRRLITVHRSFNGPTKSDDVRYVPILNPLLPLLREWKLKTGGKLVFTNRDGKMFGESARIFQEVLRRVLVRAGFPPGVRSGKATGYVVFHDLRHTFASHWVLTGGDLFKLQKILGHKTTTMTLRYAHLAPEAFSDDLDRIGGYLHSEAAQLLEFPTKN